MDPPSNVGFIDYREQHKEQELAAGPNKASGQEMRPDWSQSHGTSNQQRLAEFKKIASRQ